MQNESDKIRARIRRILERNKRVEGGRPGGLPWPLLLTTEAQLRPLWRELVWLKSAGL